MKIVIRCEETWVVKIDQLLQFKTTTKGVTQWSLFSAETSPSYSLTVCTLTDMQFVVFHASIDSSTTNAIHVCILQLRNGSYL
jgi:hypothetical protein